VIKMTTQTLTTQFDRTTAVHPIPAGADALVFAADLDESWRSLSGIHGGYMTALAVRAAEATVPNRTVRTVSTSFFRPAAPGPAELHIDVLRSGRSLTTLVSSLRQGDREIAQTRITLIADVAGNDWDSPVIDYPAPLADCVSFTPPPGIRHFEQALLRIDPATIPMSNGDDSRIAGHARPIESRPFDAAWLTMIGDWFPPAPFRRHLPPTGGVSIDYTVHLHRTLPAADDLWLSCVFDARTSVDGMALEHGSLSTPDGIIVTETFHTRWTV
jgi:acyl-CoA thioesterase